MYCIRMCMRMCMCTCLFVCMYFCLCMCVWICIDVFIDMLCVYIYMYKYIMRLCAIRALSQFKKRVHCTCVYMHVHLYALKSYQNIHIYKLYICILYIYIVRLTGERRCIGCPILIGHFPQKSPMVSGSFVENDLQFKASYGSSPPCTGWRRPIGRLKVQVILRKRAINYRALL